MKKDEVIKKACAYFEEKAFIEAYAKQMEKYNLEIEYKVSGIINNIPSCIVRKITGNDIFKIEYCNRAQSWKENPDLISYWWGSSDDGYGSPPDGDDMPIEDIKKILKQWEKNWEND